MLPPLLYKERRNTQNTYFIIYHQKVFIFPLKRRILINIVNFP